MAAAPLREARDVTLAVAQLVPNVVRDITPDAVGGAVTPPLADVAVVGLACIDGEDCCDMVVLSDAVGARGVAEDDGEPVGKTEGVLAPDAVAAGGLEAPPVGVVLGEPLELAVLLRLTAPERDARGDTVPPTVVDGENDADGEPEVDTDAEVLRVALEETLARGLFDAVAAADVDQQAEGVARAEPVTEAHTLWDAPALSVVAEVAVAAAARLASADADWERDARAEEEALRDSAAEREKDADALLLSDAAKDALAPDERDEEGHADVLAVALELAAELRDPRERVADALASADAEDANEALGVAVPALDTLAKLVLDTAFVLLLDSVADKESSADGDAKPDCDDVCDDRELRETCADADELTDAAAEFDADTDPEELMVAPRDTLAAFELLALREVKVVRDIKPVDETVMVDDNDAWPVALDEPLREDTALRDATDERVGVSEGTDGNEVRVTLPVALCEALPEGLPVAVAVAMPKDEPVGDNVDMVVRVDATEPDGQGVDAALKL